MKIHVLDRETAQLIAAGEVVERPSSVVKELLENAIDAGASLVTLEIQNGGVRYIRVSDNGCGIAAEDVPKVFLRHATSKITKEDDLAAIGTLGFRGEAMASIHAVSRVELLSKTPGALEGVRYAAEGEEDKNTPLEERMTPVGCPVGTTIIARDLFFNTPARMKFLKKDNAEANSVAAVLEKTALSHPEISFKFIRDGKLKLHTPGDGKRLSAIYAVEGREFAQGLIPVDYINEEIHLTGYISRLDASRSNRSMQNFFVNGRFVRSRTAAAALEEAYKHSIMVGKFPACVLEIEIPFDQTDVNVHPAKIELRFANEKAVFDSVYYGVKTALGQSERALPPPTLIPKTAGTSLPQRMTAVEYRALAQEQTQIKQEAQPFAQEKAGATFQKLQLLNRSTQINDMLPLPNRSPLQTLPQQEVLAEEAEIQKEENIAAFSQENRELRLVGELFSTYLVLESAQAMILVDKHAAHERLIFDKLKALSLSEDRQILLEPVLVKLSREDYQGVLGKTEALLQIGFLAEDFGDGDLLIREVPVLLEQGDIKEIIEQAAHSLALQKRDLTPQVQDDLLHSVACKSAIRAGDKNKPLELFELVKLLQQNPDVRSCPHGRPIAKSFSRTELEKLFGRQ